MKTRILPIEDERYQPYRVMVTRRSVIEEKPGVVKGFVEASLRGWKEYLEDPGPVPAELLRLNPELSAKKMAYSWNALKEGRYVLGDPAKGDRHGAMDDRRLRAEYEILKDLKLLKTDIDYHKAYYTNVCNAPR